ncbi:MAG: DUF1376 domain-containing protein [Pseudomonadota bacterium]
MTKLHSMPFFPADFFADTEHMSDDAAKAYLFLLGHAWLRGAKLPNDDSALARMARLSPRKWAAVKAAIMPFWTVDEEGFLAQRRLTKEHEFVTRRANKNRENGSNGGRKTSHKKMNEINETHQNVGSKNETQIKAPTPTPTNTNVFGADLGSNSEAKTMAARKRIAAAYGGGLNAPLDIGRVALWVSQGYDPDVCAAVIEAHPNRPHSLKWFDNPIRDAHDGRRKIAAPAPPPSEVDWDRLVAMCKQTGVWPKGNGPNPGYGGCRAPKEVLEKYGFKAISSEAA